MSVEQYNQVCEWHHVVRTWVNFDKLLRGDVCIDVWVNEEKLFLHKKEWLMLKGFPAGLRIDTKNYAVINPPKTV